ncbi:MAG: DUF3604 domain-containing protein [Candidatus Thiodiazotropha sp. (ex Monitilora ramsayi)]|nr:DUF3604 domain-containing protein [Candidatus Thiodiazotropha sp. (ex Monitilora ramsayi)]
MQEAAYRSNALFGAAIALSIFFVSDSHAQDAPKVAPSETATYSPYITQDFPNRVLFGDTHLHTRYSTDAGLIGTSLGPEEAYRFARGEAVVSSTGIPAKLQRPLDFLVVADHSENFGLEPALDEKNKRLLANAWATEVEKLYSAGDLESKLKAYDMWQEAMNTLIDPLAKEAWLGRDMWKRYTAAAEQYNNPGVFSALIGYEWTPQPNGRNLHRVVIFRDGKEKADSITPFSAYDSEDPEDLWRWMAKYESSTGGSILALAHNGNLSNGLMFDDVTLSGKPLSADYAKRRRRWEPIYEVTQMKGTGETHPALSPDDEFAEFELFDRGSFGPEPKTRVMLPREYARAAYMRGLAYEVKLGVNPFKFGMVGSTDSHTGLATSAEDQYFGKVAALEPTADPIRFDEIVTGRPGPEAARTYAWQLGTAGLAAVWARENTRTAIWDAFKRKEVYATTGTRMRVRVFAGWGLAKSDLDRSDFARHGYEDGVPMGGDLTKAPKNKSPSLLIRAIRDPDGANLDRVQIIKGWLDKTGKTHEKIYDVACSDGRQINSENRCATPVGNTVNVKNANYTNAIGDPFLQVHWTDPAFDVSEHAFYYVRVLEIPTPRWTTFDAKIFGVKLPEGAPKFLQERAYTSPIWFTPG